MKCQWCGRDIFTSDRYWTINGRGVFCSEKCLREWEWESGGGKREAEWQRHLQEEREKDQRSKDQYHEDLVEKKRSFESEIEHFRPFIEKRVGHPLSLKDVWWNQRTQSWGAKEEIQAEARRALKALEAETGTGIANIPEVAYFFEQGYFTWFSFFKRWGFRIPDRFYISGLDRVGKEAVFENGRVNRIGEVGWIGENGSHYAGHPAYSTDWGDHEDLPNKYVHWVAAQDLAPLIAVAEYEKKRLQDLNLGQRYSFIPEISWVVSREEIDELLVRQCPSGTITVYPEFSPEDNKFYYNGSELKKPSLFQKLGTWVPYRVEISLYDLQIRIPVKNIPVNAPPDEFDEEEEFYSDEDEFEYEEEDEDEEADYEEGPGETEAAPAAAPKFCGQCGARLTAGAKFCGGCGAKIG